LPRQEASAIIVVTEAKLADYEAVRYRLLTDVDVLVAA
jgi:hypothetical protein